MALLKSRIAVLVANKQQLDQLISDSNISFETANDFEFDAISQISSISKVESSVRSSRQAEFAE